MKSVVMMALFAILNFNTISSHSHHTHTTSCNHSKQNAPMLSSNDKCMIGILIVVGGMTLYLEYLERQNKSKGINTQGNQKNSCQDACCRADDLETDSGSETESESETEIVIDPFAMTPEMIRSMKKVQFKDQKEDN